MSPSTDEVTSVRLTPRAAVMFARVIHLLPRAEEPVDRRLAVRAGDAAVAGAELELGEFRVALNGAKCSSPELLMQSAVNL
jgi:hypothetical protein